MKEVTLTSTIAAFAECPVMAAITVVDGSAARMITAKAIPGSVLYRATVKQNGAIKILYLPGDYPLDFVSPAQAIEVGRRKDL